MHKQYYNISYALSLYTFKHCTPEPFRNCLTFFLQVHEYVDKFVRNRRYHSIEHEARERIKTQPYTSSTEHYMSVSRRLCHQEVA